MDTNYFVCTLGQAAALEKQDQSFRNINDFIDRQASRVGEQPAIGFVRPSQEESQPWHEEVLTFEDVQRGTQVVAQRTFLAVGPVLEAKQAVALLCPSTADFLFAWLGLMRLGHPVLILAPQCQPPAIAHLCKICGITCLFYDDTYEDQAKASAELMRKTTETEFSIFSVPFILGKAVFDTIRQEPSSSLSPLNVSETDIAYLHHTSGTSSGLPKPIPQSHRAAVGVLPRLPASKDKQRATFTTTPLYHGGPADIFRAWTSDSLIWLFPGKHAPITARNICTYLRCTKERLKRSDDPPVGYFASVPYVLQMMEADEEGLGWLKSMDIVGVGGAALPIEVGDRLVAKGVNLISRFGSAECGFLMSSHRDYEKDREWQYLRSSYGSQALRFEPQEDGTAELVVLPGWPHMAKTNRPDGSFATADLFMPHPHIKDAWKYHSRADSQLTLVTGKKFDPAPLESAIAASPLLDDTLIFGNGKPFPGVLLFRSKASAETSDEELLQSLWPSIQSLNRESQDHARIDRNMLIPMPFKDNNLEKSSKGTILRGKAEGKYKETIENAYSDSVGIDASRVPDGDVQKFILNTVGSLVAKPDKLTPDTDLFSYGVDSLACMQIRYSIQQLLASSLRDLPLSVVEDCGTVRKLSNFVVKRRHGEQLADAEDEHQLMRDLVQQYAKFDDDFHQSANTNGYQHEDSEVVVLTGATGALGAHILDLYRHSDSVSRIYCLVRGADEHAARERVSKALERRGLSCLSNEDASKVVVLQAQLSDARLGLDDNAYGMLAREATLIMHIAWSVNFRMRLRSFVRDNIAGVQHLVNLALQSPRAKPPKFAYCSSVASAMSISSGEVPERVLDDPSTASPLGYSRSKWVAEQICLKAHDNTRLHSRVAVFRVGQLSGDSQRGVWNTKEAWPMMLSSVKLTGSLPALEGEPLNWLPVDVAAKAFVEAAADMSRADSIKVYHVLNEHKTPDWIEMLGWLQKMQKFEIVSPRKWVEQLEGLGGKAAEHPAMKLLGHWKKAYCGGRSQGEDAPSPTFAMEQTVKAAPVLRTVHPVDEEYFRKIWGWLQSSM